MQKTKSLILIGLGTCLEWAEYTVYGYCALTLAQLFFYESNSYTAVLKTFTVFAVGYFMRPIGALLFGHIGDRFGRRPALLGALLLMGLATFGMGLLPTYEQIGITAPILLCALRLMQGIAVSGEFNGAAIYCIESSKRYPTLMGAWISANAALGMVIGGLAALWIAQPNTPSWAWRCPFLLGGIIAMMGLVMRRRLGESDAFIQEDSTPNLTTSEYLKSCLYVGLCATFAGVFVYINNVYIVVYLVQQNLLNKTQAMQFAISSEGLSVLSILFWGYKAKQQDPRSMLYTGFTLALFSPLFFTLLHQTQFGFCALLFALINGLTSAPMMKCLVDQFPTHYRYKGISFSWSVSVALFAGTAPVVAHHMVHQWQLSPGWYVALVAFFCLACLPWLDYKNRLTSRMKMSCNPPFAN